MTNDARAPSSPESDRHSALTPPEPLPGVHADAESAERVFNAPWEAQAYAIAVSLHARGAFAWSEWTQALAAVIDEVRQRGEADTGEHYYRHWLTALERIATRKGLVTEALLRQRHDQWEEAARRTPHGKPIELLPPPP